MGLRYMTMMDLSFVPRITATFELPRFYLASRFPNTWRQRKESLTEIKRWGTNYMTKLAN